MLLALLFAFLGSDTALAGPVVNCNAFWKAYSGVLPCEEVFPSNSDGSGKFRYFHYSDEWDSSPAKLKLFETVVQAVKDTEKTYQPFGSVPPAYFVLLKYPNPSDTPGFVNDAMAAPKNRGAGEACPVLLYPSSVTMNPADLKQVIAHELFHCFQGENFRAQLLGSGADGLWWIEGSADYFSNVVYPKTNHEWEHQKEFDPQSQIHVQSNFYAPSSFFQVIGNETNLGPGWLAEYFFRSMPKQAGADLQRAALSDAAGVYTAFHHFGQQLVTHTIPDSGGGALPIPYDLSPNVVEVEKNSRSYPLPVRPWTVKTTYFRLPSGAKYTFTNFRNEALKGHLQVSMRRLPSSAWVDLSYVDQTLDVTCDESPIIVELLMTRTENTGEPITSDVAVQVEEGSCSCDTEKGKVDPCAVGKWELDNSVFEQVFSQTLNSGEYLGTTGSLFLDISSDKTVIFSFDQLNNSIQTDVGLGPILIETIFEGKFFGKLGVTPSGKSCLRPVQDTTNVKTRVHLGNGAPVENVAPNPLSGGGGSSSETDLKCSATQIRYRVTTDTIDVEGVLNKR